MAVEITLSLDAGNTLTTLARLLDRFEEVFEGIKDELDEYSDESEESFDKSKKAGEESASGISRAFKAVGETLIATGAAIAGTATALFALTNQVTQNVLETANYADVLGISAQQLNVFETAALRAGGDVNDLRESFRTAQENISEFVNLGTGTATEALSVLGVRLTDTQGNVRDVAQTFPELVAALGKVPNAADQTRLAIQLFGEEDSRVLVQLARNPAAFAEAEAAIAKYGTALGGPLVTESRTFQGLLRDVGLATQGFANEIVGALLPSINAILPRILDWVTGLRESDAVQKTLIPTIQEIISYLGYFGTAIKVIEVAWIALNIAFNAVVAGLATGFKAIIDGLGFVVSFAGAAAEALGFEGISQSINGVASTLDGLSRDAGLLAQVATETGQEWRDDLGKTQRELELTAKQDTAAIKVVVDNNKQATESQAKVTQALAGTTAEVTKAKGAAEQAFPAYSMEIAKVKIAVEQFSAITERSFSNASASATGFKDTLAQLTPAATAASSGVGQAFANLGIQSTRELQGIADKAVRNFEQIRAGGSESVERLRQIFVEQVLPKLTEGYQKHTDQVRVLQKGITASAIQQFAIEIAKGQEKDQALTDSAAAYSIQATGANQRAADAAIREFQRTFDSGALTKEGLARLYVDELVPQIFKAYGTIPPHLQALHERMEAIVRESLGQQLVAYNNYATQVSSVYDGLTGKIRETIKENVRDVTDIIGQGFRSVGELANFGATVEELTIQLGKAKDELALIGSSLGRPGSSTDIQQFQLEQQRALIAELEKRRNELLQRGEGGEDLRQLLGFDTPQDGGGSLGGGPSQFGSGGAGGSPGSPGSGSRSLPVDSSAGANRLQQIIDEALRNAGVGSPAEFNVTITSLQQQAGGGGAGLQEVFTQFPQLAEIFRLLAPPQTSQNFTERGTAPETLLPPPFTPPPARSGGGGSSGFNGSPLRPNLDPLGLGAGGATRSAGASAGVTFASGSITVNTQARDANALAAELVPALNAQIRRGALQPGLSPGSTNR